jgi:hypothetical protein
VTQPPASGATRIICCRCSRDRALAARFPDGPLCTTCLDHARRTRGTCPGCGQAGTLPGRTAAAVPICGDCAGITRRFDCRRCGAESRHGRLCDRCKIADRADRLLGGQAALAPLAGALHGSTNPAATLNWLNKPHIAVLLTDLSAGRLALTHQALAARPDWRATIYLCDLLMDCGLLPAADRQLLHYDGWLRRRLDDLAGHPHHQLLRQFGVWHQLARMRARAATAPLRPTARQYAEQRFTTACQFLTWVHDRGGHPARLTQADLDTWHVTCRAYQRPAGRAFFTWAMDSGHMARLDLPTIRFGTGEAITQQQRITLLRRYALTDQDPLRVRAAACLMLLYAQPLSRILRLTLTDLGQQPGGQICLRIGEPPSPVPDPFAQVLLLQAGRAALTTSTWLFPGRNLGQPAAYATVFNQLRSLGFPMRAGRVSALRELVAQAPAPVIADALGFHQTTTHRQHINAGATWSRYATRH